MVLFRERADFPAAGQRTEGDRRRNVIFFSGLEPWQGTSCAALAGSGLDDPHHWGFATLPECASGPGDALEGAMYFDIYNVDSPSPENQSVSFASFAPGTADLPDHGPRKAYDALHILAKAFKFTGSRNPSICSLCHRYMDAWEGANGRSSSTAQGARRQKPYSFEMFSAREAGDDSRR